MQDLIEKFNQAGIVGLAAAIVYAAIKFIGPLFQKILGNMASNASASGGLVTQLQSERDLYLKKYEEAMDELMDLKTEVGQLRAQVEYLTRQIQSERENRNGRID